MRILRVVFVVMLWAASCVAVYAQTCPDGQTMGERWCRSLDQNTSVCANGDFYKTALAACKSIGPDGTVVTFNGSQQYKRTINLGAVVSPTAYYCEAFYEPMGQSPVIPTGIIAMAVKQPDGCLPAETEQCLAGQTKKLNTTLGYNSTPSKDVIPEFKPDGSPNPTGGIPPTQGVCVNGCRRSVSAVERPWVSEEPTDKGLYRVSMDAYWTTESATPCTQGDAEKAQSAPDAPTPSTCQGAFGYVSYNGSPNTPVCVPNVPYDPIPAQPPVTIPSGITTGNPTAGTEGGPQNIPSSGNGGNAGGPANTKDGTVTFPTGITINPNTSTTSGTKTAVPGQEQVACGAPGQPPCKIDESGVTSTFNPAGDPLQAATDAAVAQRNTIAGTTDKGGMFQTFTGLFEVPPLASCQPFTLPSVLGMEVGTVDPCQYLDPMRDVMGIIWALCGFWLCLGMIKEVM